MFYDNYSRVRKLIELASRNRLDALQIAGGLPAFGIYSVNYKLIDAIPDLSGNQVIVFSEWMGSLNLIENQVTYLFVSNLQVILKVKDFRGSSMFGRSFVVD